MSSAASGVQIFDSVVNERDQRLREVFIKLEETVSEKTLELDKVKATLANLQDDFLYNLKLLKDRDVELEKYDSLKETWKIETRNRQGMFDSCHHQILNISNNRDVEISELKIALSDKSAELENLRNLLEAQEGQHAEEVRKMRIDGETALQRAQEVGRQRVSDLELSCSTAQERLRTALQEVERLREFEGQCKDLRSQVAESKREFTNKLRDLENALAESRQDLENVSTSLEDQKLQISHEADLKIKAKESEIDALKRSIATKDSTIVLLEGSLGDIRTKRQEIAEELSKELDEKRLALADSQTEVAKLKQKLSTEQCTYDAERKKLEKETVKFRRRCESDFTKLQQKYKYEISRLMSELKRLIKLSSQLKDDLDAANTHIAELQSESSARSENEISLKQKLAEATAKVELEKRAIELSNGHKRETEALLRSFQEERRKFAAERKTEKASQTRSSSPPVQEPQLDWWKDKVFELEQQNAELRNVIRQMRQDMESMQALASSPNYPRDSHGRPFTPPAQPVRDAFAQDTMAVHDQLATLTTLLTKKQAIIESLLTSKAEGDVSAATTPNRVVIEKNYNAVVSENEELRVALSRVEIDNGTLRSKLREAVEDLAVSATERIKLADLSNSLRAELSHYLDSSGLKNAGTQSKKFI
ncbi:hypothetical protein HDU76_008074 [Blyttiomyces sp. JEL0837]|nr:hypothetical protein HDU76_008074 [Blyttiomyces sp. JEL0837]